MALSPPPNAQCLIPNALLSRLRQNADLSKTNWFRVGGRAEWLFRPEDAKDLSAFLSLLPAEIPVTVLGVGSNVIIRDGGIDGVVIKLGRGFAQLSVASGQLSAGAATLDIHVAQFACELGLSGLEFLSGIPGTIGGAVRMNAGAYGSDTSQVLVEAEIVERNGKFRTLSHAELGFSYRHSALPKGAIVTRATFKVQPGDKQAIAAGMAEIQKSREETQPIRARTGGSTFRNPPGEKAWELLDRAGCRGLIIGGAQVSEKHCNFLINTGNASAADLENLGEEVRRRVLEKTGIRLEWEIERIGKSE
ncbi:MAG: UDP-N-acetylmuramate dehydrogenase [Pseudomonadota bacterium]|nr:UDP-N-acetylmuramate dehydrogenase [Pseudomonadota bacterium]